LPQLRDLYDRQDDAATLTECPDRRVAASADLQELEAALEVSSFTSPSAMAHYLASSRGRADPAPVRRSRGKLNLGVQSYGIFLGSASVCGLRFLGGA